MNVKIIAIKYDEITALWWCYKFLRTLKQGSKLEIASVYFKITENGLNSSNF